MSCSVSAAGSETAEGWDSVFVADAGVVVDESAWWEEGCVVVGGDAGGAESADVVPVTGDAVPCPAGAFDSEHAPSSSADSEIIAITFFILTFLRSQTENIRFRYLDERYGKKLLKYQQSDNPAKCARSGLLPGSPAMDYWSHIY